LDAIDGTSLADGDGAIVIDATNNKTYHFTLNATSGVAESSPWTTSDVIAPDANGGNKRWELCHTQDTTYDDMATFLAATTLTGALAGLGLTYDQMWLPAKVWNPTTTNGCAAVATYSWDTGAAGADEVETAYLAFDGATEEYADFSLVMPPAWDRSTLLFKFYWASATGSTAGDTVEWQIQGVSAADDDALDQAYTDTGEVITDTLLANNGTDLHRTSLTPAVTINGTPGLDDFIHLKVSRNVGGTDDMTEDAWLFGVLMQYKITNKVAVWS
jgi:hypothetical protein